MEPSGEIWQVDIDGTLYEADADTLKQWVLDGYITPYTKVQKGTLKWIEAGRVPAIRGLFASGPAFPTLPPEPPPPSDWSTPEVPSYGPTSAAAVPAYSPYEQPASPAGYGMCLTHRDMRAKYMCQGCGAALCTGCTKRYGNAAVCSICGELCRPFGEAQAKITKTADRYSPFGMNDFAAAVRFPTADFVGIAIAAVIFGVLLMFGAYGRAFGAALLFGYMSGAIRRVSMGRIDEGPVPELDDPGDLVFTAGKLGIAVALITFGPLIAVFTTGMTHLPTEPGTGAAVWLAGMGGGFLLAGLWALFYYPMALLIAGYTQDFVAVINPLVGLSTMKRMGSVYAKAFGMYIAAMAIQFVFILTFRAFKAFVPSLGLGAVPEAFIYFAENVAEGAITFFISMVIAAILGLAVYKRADELDVYVAN